MSSEEVGNSAPNLGNEKSVIIGNTDYRKPITGPVMGALVGNVLSCLGGRSDIFRMLGLGFENLEIFAENVILKSSFQLHL
jgi:hypothetical protein